MQEFLNILDPDIDTELINITFNIIDNRDSKQLVYYDDIDIVSINKNLITLKYIRKVFFSPEGIFNLSVSYRLNLRVKDEYEEIIDLSKYNILQELKDNENKILSEVISKACLTIGFITLQYLDMPLTLPPIFKKKHN